MPKFDEHALEMSIMKLFEKEGYTYVHGDRIQRINKTQVLIEEDLREYLKTRYCAEGLTKSEIDSIILSLHAISGTLYEDNKQILQKISDGFIFNREDRSKKDIYIELLDYEPDAEKNRNIYKIVNQFEIEGYNNQLRIPDGIVFVNGIPLVVLEFKSAIKENTTIMDAYTQLTVRYQRDIPEIFKYNAFVVICDGANSKYGSLFSPYDFFYAWRKVEDNDPEMDGINSLYTMVNGLFRKDRLLDVVKNFIYFPDTSNNSIKVVCRYPQYFAANNLYENVKAHIKPEGDGKGGTYFGTTGCGKSYTMLFFKNKFFTFSCPVSPLGIVSLGKPSANNSPSKSFNIQSSMLVLASILLKWDMSYCRRRLSSTFFQSGCSCMPFSKISVSYSQNMVLKSTCILVVVC